MAHLEVEPKPRPLWVWALIALLAILLAGMLISKCSADGDSSAADSLSNDTSQVLAKTTPDWSRIDFNSATQTDADIADSEIQTRGGSDYTIYMLGENILFPSAGNDLSEKGIQKLRLIADVLKKRFPEATIGVFGSTDSTGPADENKELGRERATVVRNWLADQGKVKTENVSVQSLGETEPVATNQTKSGRQQNRNVSIVVFPKP
jgi:outer membrane protein OmpA-like peptidoglycan-associated protein